MSTWYLWLKALHIFGVVCWFAGIFYLPRLLVNIVMTDEPIVRQHLLLMANKLFRFMNVLLYLALIPGGALLISHWSAFGTATWMWLKLALITGLIHYHFISGKYLSDLAAESCDKSEKYFRVFNEVPVILLILVVLLVVLKPF